MGKEWSGVVRVDGATAHAQVHLDGTSLRIGGERRLTVALAAIESAVIVEGTLRLHAAQGTIELDLGPPRARSWREAIVSPKTLLQKLGVRATDRVCVKGLTDAAFLADLGRVVDGPPASEVRGTFDVVFLGVATESDLDEVQRAREHLAPTGALWIVHPKGKGSPVAEARVREAFQRCGMFDAKVVAFSPTHTAVKAMIPLAARARA